MSPCKAGSRFAARLLLIIAPAAALVGCSSSSQQRPQGFEYAGHGLYQTHYEQSSQLHSKRRVLHDRTITTNKTNARHRKNNYSTKVAESHVMSKMEASSFVRPDDKSNIVTTTPTVPTKTEIPPTQPDDESVMKQAKATIAAKMGDPNSVEFEVWERAARKNALGNSIDIICGLVRDKSSGPRSFLYLVQKDEAYIGGYNIAISEYRWIVLPPQCYRR